MHGSKCSINCPEFKWGSTVENMSHPGIPYEGESRLEQLRYAIILAVSMLIPPIHSLERMEGTCKRLIAKNPKAVTPRSFLADTYRIYNKNEAACFEYEELCKLVPLSAKDRIRFAEVLFRLKNFDRVIEVSEEVVAEHLNETNANWYLAMSFMETRRYAQAAKYFQRSISSNNSKGRYKDYWGLGFCLAKAGQDKEALEAYKSGLELNPECGEHKQNITWVQSRLDQISDENHNLVSLQETNGTPPNPPPI